MEKFNKLNFNIISQIGSKYTDSNSIIMTGVNKPENQSLEELLKMINDDVKSSGFITDGEFTNLRLITGNVRQASGDYRYDWLLEMKEGTKVNPVKRLIEYSFFKWTSDFIINFKDDYFSFIVDYDSQLVDKCDTDLSDYFDWLKNREIIPNLRHRFDSDLEYVEAIEFLYKGKLVE